MQRQPVSITCGKQHPNVQTPIHRHPLPNEASDPGLRFETIDHQNHYDFEVMHRHDYYEVLLFLSGDTGQQLIDFVEHEIEANCLYIITPGQVHLMQRKPKENGILVQFTAEFLRQSIHPFDADWNYHLRACAKLPLSASQRNVVQAAMQELNVLLGDTGAMARHKLRHRFALFFLEVIELASARLDLSKASDTATRFIREAEQNFHQLRTISLYAEQLEVPVKKLTAEVKQRYGKSPLQIVHELLYVEIKRMLRVDRLSHKEISYKLHFDDQSSYTRFVKKMGNMTPTQLKNSLADSSEAN